MVALRTEGVDRNTQHLGNRDQRRQVALRTEGVDRNHNFTSSRNSSRVALRTEGVDRNLKKPIDLICKLRRPPYGGRG